MRSSIVAAGAVVAAGCSRYSSDFQDASSIEQHQRKCREKAAENGHDLRAEFEFADQAVSGTRPDRTGLPAMLAAARERQFVDVTHVLNAIERGDPKAAAGLLPVVSSELRKLAAARMADEKPGQILQATALVHDAYIRHVDGDRVQRWSSRGHFFAAAAEATLHPRRKGPPQGPTRETPLLCAPLSADGRAMPELLTTPLVW